jgi:pimeloyl-ACP methyl ester carboxylesterase
MRGRTASRDDIPLVYEFHGSARPALVFVHGWSCDRRYWRDQVTGFASRYQTVAIDLAGHGESGAGRREWSISAFSEDVVAVADDLGLPEMVLVGHSMGGDVIVEAASRLGVRVAGLVWVDTYRTLGDPLTSAQIQEFLAPFRRDFVGATRDLISRFFRADADPELREWVVADMAGAPQDIAVDALEHSISNEGPIIAGLRQLSAPIVAINPDYRPTDVEALERHGVQSVIMPGVGHFPMLEKPSSFNRLLSDVIHEFLPQQ